MKKLTKEEFIEKAIKIHGYKYDYSLVDYKGGKVKVKIICKEHGVFNVTPSSHLQGVDCKECGIENMKNSKRKKLQTFIDEANVIHNNKYKYTLVDYEVCDKNVIILCPDHGKFEITPSSHLSGYGCNKCSKSRTNTEEFDTANCFNTRTIGNID